MQEIKIHPEGPHISRLVYGAWRMLDGNLSKQEAERNIRTCIELGINWFDHADIYGNYDCEEFFGSVYKSIKSSLPELHFVTKTDIMLLTDKYPTRQVKHYDTSPAHIELSVENSLRNLYLDKIDILLLHRPDPLMNVDETAGCLDKLVDSGKVLYIGVSNFTPSQFTLLQSRMKNPLITNQIEVSLNKIESLANGDFDFLYEHKIHPMAWSPLGGGSLMRDVDHMRRTSLGNNPGKRLNSSISSRSSNIVSASKSDGGIASLTEMMIQLSEKYETTENALALSWLLRHPIGIIPVIGSNSYERIQEMVKSLDLVLNREDWFLLYQSAMGKEVA